MTDTRSRRDFLRSAGTASLGLGMGGLLSSPLRARARPSRGRVEFDSRLEPLVRLLEATPRATVLEEVGARIRQGTTYEELVTALFLAGIRNIPPRPDVGFKFHAVLGVPSAHLASMAAPGQDRWLPLFFAIDFFKGQQAYDEQTSDWSLPRVDEDVVPQGARALAALPGAMDRWDDPAADAAVAGLVRTADPAAVFEQVAPYGMREFRDMGHKAIFLAGAFRTLEVTGWRYAEPVLRSLVFALLNHHGDPNPASCDLEVDRPWRRNVELADEIRADWQDGDLDSEATCELLATLRSDDWPGACAHLVEQLNAGISSQSVRDALFVASAEQLMRQPGIYALHAVTTTNALMHAYRTTSRERTRRLLLLQNAAFLVQFREYLRERSTWRGVRIDEMEAAPSSAARREAMEEIFAHVSSDPDLAAGQVLAQLHADQRFPGEFMRAARKLVTHKAQNSHHYKFSSAVFEDYGHVSPGWRDRYLAASVYYLRGTGHPDSKLLRRTREAVRGPTTSR